MDPAPTPLVLAHRGDHRRAAENSLAAFRAAMRVPGCGGVELDVRRSGDGEAVVIHDASLARVQGRPDAVAGTSSAILSGRGVPRLADVLAVMPRDAFVDVELKDPVAERAAAAIVASRGPEFTASVVSSFEPGILRGAARVAAAWPRWLIAEDAAAIDTAADMACQGIALDWRVLTRQRVERAHGLGLIVMAWTLRRSATRLRVAGLGVDVLCVEGAALGPRGR